MKKSVLDKTRGQLIHRTRTKGESQQSVHFFPAFRKLAASGKIGALTQQQ